MTKYLLPAALLYLLFVVYGSLVPLTFQLIPFSQALERYANIPYLNLGIGSLADWVANILLMIPLAFLWLTWLSKNANFFQRLSLFVLIWIACFLLALAIEFTQLFFPPRTVSLNDIIAESLGSFIGCIVGWFFGGRFITWLQTWDQEAEANSWGNYLQIYIAGMFLYAVLPLDLTLSPIELFHKWREGRIIFVPFTNLKSGLVENIYQWGADIALWFPVPILWQLKSRLNTLQLYLRIFLAAFAVEFFQVFVYSRVTDTTDIVLAMLGGGLSIHITQYVQSKRSENITQANVKTVKNPPAIWGVLMLMVWGILLVALFWYPFNFETDTGLITNRYKEFFKVPFYSYYYGTEYRAATEVIHKILFFVPLGMTLSFISSGYFFSKASRYISYCWIIIFAFAIELGQFFLPSKNSDVTDFVLEIIGGLIGYKVFKTLINSHHIDYIPGNSQALSHIYGNNIIKRSFLVNVQFIILLVSLILSTVILRWLSAIHFIPYNVRELIAGEYAWLRCLGISILLFWCIGFPVWFLARILAAKKQDFWIFWRGASIHSTVTCVLILISAPMESIHDVVGSPILINIPAKLELFIRLLAFFGIYSLLLFGAVMMTNSLLSYYSKLMKYYLSGFFCGLIWFSVFWGVVVVQAATDNITELLPDEGWSWRIMFAGMYVFMFTFIGSGFSALLAQQQWRKLIWIVIAALISYPLGYWLIESGTEQFILKYDVVFSALQFLLSSDRNHFVTGDALEFRFYIAHTVFLVTVAITQFPQWLAISRNKSSNDAVHKSGNNSRSPNYV